MKDFPEAEAEVVLEVAEKRETLAKQRVGESDL